MTEPPTHPAAGTPQWIQATNLLEQAQRRWAAKPPVTLQLQRGIAFSVLCCMQMLVRAPAPYLHPSMRELLVAEGRRLQEMICDDAELYAMAEASWYPSPGDPPASGQLEQALDRWATLPPITLHTEREAALHVLGCLQMLAKAPDTDPATRKLLVAEGRPLQEIICDDAELYAMIEAGWRHAPTGKPTRSNPAPGLFRDPPR